MRPAKYWAQNRSLSLAVEAKVAYPVTVTGTGSPREKQVAKRV